MDEREAAKLMQWFEESDDDIALDDPYSTDGNSDSEYTPENSKKRSRKFISGSDSDEISANEAFDESSEHSDNYSETEYTFAEPNGAVEADSDGEDGNDLNQATQ